MKKSLTKVLLVVAAVLCIAGAAGYYYYYRYVEPVTKYYVVTGVAPNFAIRGAGVFPSWDAAVKAVEGQKNNTNAGLEKELAKIDANTMDGEFKARALLNLLSKRWILLEVSSNRALDEGVINELQKSWNNPAELEALCSKYRIVVNVQEL